MATGRPQDVTNGGWKPSAVQTAWEKALGGGVPGIAAQAAQVSALMWLHTTLNFQYKYGIGLQPTLSTLWSEGGLPRLYRGFGYALVLSPATRFLDTASNAGCLSLLDSYKHTSDLPLAAKTFCGSAVASVTRVALLPLDFMKTARQVEGANAVSLIAEKYRHGGPRIFFHGALASTTSSIISHFPWFYTYNLLDGNLPQTSGTALNIVRSAAIGFTSATASAVASNWARVIKTNKQTSPDPNTSYIRVVRAIIEQGGVLSLFGRGLTTKIAINGIQSSLFTVLWKLGQDAYAERAARPAEPVSPDPAR
eukprot:jgi/Ulvmu1/9542/UM053_0031.1